MTDDSTGIQAIRVNGQDFEVQFDHFTEQFSAVLDGSKITDKSYSELRKTLAVLTKKLPVRVNIPVLRIVQGELRSGIVYSLHAATGNPMVRWDDGTKEQEASYARFLDPAQYTEAEVQELREILAENRRLDARLRELTSKAMVSVENIRRRAKAELQKMVQPRDQ